VNDVLVVKLAQRLRDLNGQRQKLLQSQRVVRPLSVEGLAVKILQDDHQRMLILVQLIRADHTFQMERVNQVVFLLKAGEFFWQRIVFAGHLEDNRQLICLAVATVDT